MSLPHLRRRAAALGGGGPSGPTGLSRTTAGLVSADDFNRADGAPGAPWQIEQGAQMAIVSQVLEADFTSTGQLITNQAEDVGGGLVQAKVSWEHAQKHAGLGLRYDYNAGSMNGYELFPDDQDAELVLRRVEAGSPTNIDTAAIVLDVATVYDMQLYVADDLQEGWLSAGNTRVAGVDNTFNAVDDAALVRGLFSTTLMRWVRFDDFVWCRSKLVVVSGLPEGWKAKIRNAGSSVVAQATANAGGVATIDCSRYTEVGAAGTGATEIVPVAGWTDIQITDESDVEQFVYSDTVVYPGDAYGAA